ncbi:AraC family transcriptional regulator ligand-binding domain-containing protein [Pseudomonas sp. NY15436]|uniref:helix-turn-helix transcriptional regulator n=1 Tax=Pseudomonas sp. NY15436 TaxID=3400359 RepID=UPI003A8BA9FE
MSDFIPATSNIDYHVPCLQLLNGVRRHGLPLAALLVEAGLDLRLLEAEPVTIDTRSFIRLLRGLTRAMDDEFFGLTQHRAKQGTSALLVDLMLACSTVGAAIEQAVNFFRIVTDDIELHCEQDEEDFRLVVQLTRPELDPQGFLGDYWLIYLQRFLSWCAGRLIPVKAVSSPSPAGPGRLLDFLRRDWRPGQDRLSISISRKYWSLPIVKSRAEWHDHHAQLVQDGVLGWPGGDHLYANQVRALLRSAFVQRLPPPKLQDIAALLCMSVQTLHRHLQQEGMGYQRILDELRRDYAIDLLVKQHLSVAKAAEYLGFAETRSFSRAFKQWTGKTPSELRQLHR